MRLHRRAFAVAALVAALAASACAQDTGPAGDAALEPLKVVTSTGEHDFMVEIADDDAERQRGLMHRPPLADDRGMLFQFPEAAERAFWMHNTPSSLDIVYIGADGRIVRIAEHTTPNSDQTYPSLAPAKGVLEVRAGRMREIGAREGDQVRHPFFGNAGG